MPDQTPEPLTDFELREIVENGGGLVFTETVEEMAAELLAARARITRLAGEVQELRDGARGYEVGRQSQAARITELEATQAEPRAELESVQLCAEQQHMLELGLDPLANLTDADIEALARESEPHAYIAVKRTHSVNADCPEWSCDAAVIPATDTAECRHYAAQGYDLVPIVGTDTGTRPAAQSAPAANIDDDRCPGRCVTGADLGVSPENGGWMIANVDPECPVHGEPQSDPVGYAVVSELRDGTLAVLPSGVMSKSVAVARAAAYRAEGGYSDARVYELREVQQ